MMTLIIWRAWLKKMSLPLPFEFQKRNSRKSVNFGARRSFKMPKWRESYCCFLVIYHFLLYLEPFLLNLTKRNFFLRFYSPRRINWAWKIPMFEIKIRKTLYLWVVSAPSIKTSMVKTLCKWRPSMKNQKNMAVLAYSSKT